MHIASITIIYNATPMVQTQTVSALAGTRQALHPMQQFGADPTVKQSSYAAATGTFMVPAYTVAVFVQK